MKPLLYHWKLRSKMLLLFSVIIMMCSGIILSITSVLYTKFIRDKTEDMYSASLELMAENISNYFEGLKNGIYTVCYSNSAMNFLNTIPYKTTSEYAQASKQWLSSMRSIESLNPNTRLMFLSEIHNTVYQNFSQDYNYNYQYHHEEWYSIMQKPSSPSIMVINNPQNYLNVPRPDETYAVIYKITNWSSQTTTGYMLVQLDKSVLSSLTLNSNIISENILIYDEATQSVIYDNHEDSSRWTSTLKQIHENPVSHSTAFINNKINGEESIAAYYILPDLRWTFIFSSSYSSLLSGISVLLIAGVAATLFILIISIVSVTYFTSRITKPLEEMNKDIELMKQNNFQFQLPIFSDDEIGKLSHNFNLMVDRMDFLINKSKNASLLLKQAELDSLQQQINPHFLYNTLEMIVGLASENRSDDVIETCGQLGQIFKFNLSSKDIIPVQKELVHVKNYLAIIQKRFENKFQVVYEIDPEALQCQVIKFIMQPFVENAVIHGFQNLVSDGLLRICVTRKESDLYIAVEDNGDGISQQVIQEIHSAIARFDAMEQTDFTLTTHIGILNVCYRLKLFFGDQFSVSIEQRNPGTGIYLQVPCILPEN